MLKTEQSRIAKNQFKELKSGSTQEDFEVMHNAVYLDAKRRLHNTGHICCHQDAINDCIAGTATYNEVPTSSS